MRTSEVPTLTGRQAEVLGLIQAFIVDTGSPPTLRELMGVLRLCSQQGVAVHLDALEDKGYIKRRSNDRRGICVLRRADGEPVKLVYALKSDTGQRGRLEAALSTIRGLFETRMD